MKASLARPGLDTISEMVNAVSIVYLLFSWRSTNKQQIFHALVYIMRFSLVCACS